ncbi:MAG: helix-turn-helix transcriptional regulator [Defluviitaleaceae bacterium]|nr:helix-turn-helix transcriptional regulator [Defluviitaleaceae bacterium]
MDNGIFFLKEYGRVIITLRDVMDQKGITRNKLANLTGLVYNSINRYYQSAPISSVDLDILAKICYVLNCKIEDILKYEKPPLPYNGDTRAPVEPHDTEK